MKEQTWNTEITRVAPNELLISGYSLEELIGRVSFVDMIYLLIKKELPSQEVKKVLEGILVSSVDHGPTPPSTVVARTVTSTGAALNAALAAGILSINKYHGGAIEDCMLMLLDAVKTKHDLGLDTAETAGCLVKSAMQEKRRLAGFGHRIHTEDPRAARLFALAEEAGMAGEYVEMALAIQQAISKEKGKKIPINVDGAIASLLCELEFPSELANALFIMSRIPGLTAHVYEEKTTQKPMRHVNPKAHRYVGPDKREMRTT